FPPVPLWRPVADLPPPAQAPGETAVHRVPPVGLPGFGNDPQVDPVAVPADRQHPAPDARLVVPGDHVADPDFPGVAHGPFPPASRRYRASSAHAPRAARTIPHAATATAWSATACAPGIESSHATIASRLAR